MQLSLKLVSPSATTEHSTFKLCTSENVDWCDTNKGSRDGNCSNKLSRSDLADKNVFDTSWTTGKFILRLKKQIVRMHVQVINIMIKCA